MTVIAAAAFALALAAGTGAAQAGPGEALDAATGAPAAATGPIDDLVAPTNGAPALHQPGDPVRVELDAMPASPTGEVRLEPSFGDGPAVPLDVTVGAEEPSTLWQGPYERTVVPLTGQLPADTPPGLYDVVVPAVDERAHRAVSVQEEVPDTLHVVVIADPQTGDPRAMEDAFAESTGIPLRAPREADPRVPPDPQPFNDAVAETLGVDVLELEADPSDRWGAYRAAIERVNRMDPDVVLVSGDLTFGNSFPGSYAFEYAEAHALLNGLEGVDGTTYEGVRAPTILSPGNHDGYVHGVDGMAYWEATFGPPAFVTSFGDVTLASVNTYDWDRLDRTVVGPAISAWGGQVQADQLAWLRAELCRAQGGTPTEAPGAPAGVACQGPEDTRAVTVSHHSPSWVQDTWREAYDGRYEQCPCAGAPVVEQAARGIATFSGPGQGWTGEGRLELRETLRDVNVDLHVAGHTHMDRIARELADGTVVETPQRDRSGLDVTELHAVEPDGDAREVPFEEGSRLIDEGQGPLYVETTTAASGTPAYHGVREILWHPTPADRPAGEPGVGAFETGVPMNGTLLDALARQPDRFNASHSELGLFSTPTRLDLG